MSDKIVVNSKTPAREWMPIAQRLAQDAAKDLGGDVLIDTMVQATRFAVLMEVINFACDEVNIAQTESRKWRVSLACDGYLAVAESKAFVEAVEDAVNHMAKEQQAKTRRWENN